MTERRIQTLTTIKDMWGLGNDQKINKSTEEIPITNRSTA